MVYDGEMMNSMIVGSILSSILSDIKFEQHYLNFPNAVEVLSYSAVISVMCARSCYFWCVAMLRVSILEITCSGGGGPVNSRSETTILNTPYL